MPEKDTKKDVVYVDAEDDITAIISKVKQAKARIIALVPPKRVGVIQSTVNLKLVQRASDQAGKKLVLVSSNLALANLAASVGLPVAKNLQSKPEIPEVPLLDIDRGEDVIDGAKISADDSTSISSVKSPDDKAKPETEIDGVPLATTATAASQAIKSRIKVPNFDKFRKKLFIIIAAAVLLVGFLVWALVFAPRADIVVTARTSNSALSTKVTLGDSLSTSLRDGTIQSVTKTIDKDVSVDGTATGQKDFGTKATGTVKFTPTGVSIYLNGATIAAGTKVTASNGQVFTTDNTVVFNSDDPSSVNAAGKTTTVTAVETGGDYNGATGVASGPSGFTTGFTAPTSGGTSDVETVVQQSDVDSAMSNIGDKVDAKSAQGQLAKLFGGDYVVLSSTFRQDTSALKPNPAVDAKASDGKFTIAGKVTFSLVAIPKSQLGKFLDSYFASQIDGNQDRKVYDNGIADASFTTITAAKDGYAANLTANGKIGPKISDQDLKDAAKGKAIGEIQDSLGQIDGVEKVDVHLSPFWVQHAPGDTGKISVEFKVND